MNTRKERLKEILGGSRPRMAVLLDPDKCSAGKKLESFLHACEENGVDLLLFGGSLITGEGAKDVLAFIKLVSQIPLVLFPSHPSQIDPSADGILFLSLISGRQADYLIGHHVVAAPLLSKTDLEVIPTGYMLIDGGRTTTAHYMSGSMPIPMDKPDIAMATAMAGMYLGMRLIYMDAGSGAMQPIAQEMIRAVKSQLTIPLMIGGGIRTSEQAQSAVEAGADIVVIGNVLEEDAGLLQELSIAIHASSPLKDRQ